MSIGETSLVHHGDWIERVLDEDVESFRRSLTQQGLPDEVVQEALAAHAHVSLGAATHASKNMRFRGPDGAQDYIEGRVRASRLRGRQRLMEWFAGRTRDTESEKVQPIEIPLFYLDSPGVSGCSTSLMRSEERGESANWSVALAGSGLSSSSLLRIKVSATITSTEGHAKLIFIPVQLRIRHVVISEGGRIVGRLLECDVVDDALRPPGVRDEGSAPTTSGNPIPFQLRGDSSRAATAYSFDYATSDKLGLKIGLAGLGLKSEVGATRSLAQSVKLSATLVAGRDYFMYRVADVHGVTWA